MISIRDVKKNTKVKQHLGLYVKKKKCIWWKPEIKAENAWNTQQIRQQWQEEIVNILGWKASDHRTEMITVSIAFAVQVWKYQSSNLNLEYQCYGK